MARFKDFGNPFDADAAEKLTFKLYDEEFECYPEMQGKTLLLFVEKSNSEDVADSAAAISLFFQKVLTPESYGRFDTLANDPSKIISVQTLAEIVGWIMEQYSNRPTQGSEHSPSGE
jgi:hypothetical protein